jgi:hypothetical protein
LMRDIRTAIEKKRYGEFVGEFKEEMKIYWNIKTSYYTWVRIVKNKLTWGRHCWLFFLH